MVELVWGQICVCEKTTKHFSVVPTKKALEYFDCKIGTELHLYIHNNTALVK